MAHAGGKADHLICYKMADSAQIAAAVDMIADLQPECSQRDCRLLKPIEFCVPATKQKVNPQPGAPDLVSQPLRQDYICSSFISAFHFYPAGNLRTVGLTPL